MTEIQIDPVRYHGRPAKPRIPCEEAAYDLLDREHQVQLLVDRDVLGYEYFACHPCINTSSLQFKTADLLDKLLPALGVKPLFVTL